MKNKDIGILQKALIPKIISAKDKQIAFLQTEVVQANTEEQLVIQMIQQRIHKIKNLLDDYICSDIPNAFWDRKQNMVTLPSTKDFNKRNIPIKARLIQMDKKLLELCKKQI